MRKITLACCVLLGIVSVFLPASLQRHEFPVFRIVIDPGHGGIASPDRKKHGDRYDLPSRSYLQDFKEGASNAGLHEHAIVYSIAAKAMGILAGCAPDGNFSRFYPVLERFTGEPYDRISVECTLSRGDSRDRDSIARRRDPNAGFRVFDFPDRRGRMQPGRISYINSLRPQMVVSLHIANNGAAYYRGMNPVIAAPYSFMYRGLLYLKGVEKSRQYFISSPYRDWFDESEERTGHQWFLNDTMLYFSGFTLNRHQALDSNGFRGYRYNMVNWKYRDRDGWENTARVHPEYTQYSSSVEKFSVQGKFWEREQSVFEAYRRDGGMEGFGGDNLYASAEIIRYILRSLNLKNLSHPDQKPGRPYVSVWHLPLHVNAVNAFIELGYLNRPWYRYLLTQRQDEIAEGVAVGIYSLLAGLKPGTGDSRYTPRGKKIDLQKYMNGNNESYFDTVIPE